MLSNKDTKILAKGNSQTHTTRTPQSHESGSLDSTRLTSETLNGSESMRLEEEAKQFTAKKKYSGPPKPMTSRIYLIGMAMNALLSRSSGPMRREEVRREAESWADYMLDD
jgi:hypothetical protein